MTTKTYSLEVLMEARILGVSPAVIARANRATERCVVCSASVVNGLCPSHGFIPSSVNKEFE